MAQWLPSHISNVILSIVKVGPPGEARTPRKDRGAKDHRAPNHISKTVLSTVHLARIHRWTGMDGVRTAEGVRELQAR